MYFVHSANTHTPDVKITAPAHHAAKQPGGGTGQHT
jgi:hypothetical protein